MGTLLTPADVERMAAARGMTLRTLCSAAGIAYSTFGRWKRGETSPTLDVYERIVGAVASDPPAPAEPRAAINVAPEPVAA